MGLIGACLLWDEWEVVCFGICGIFSFWCVVCRRVSAVGLVRLCVVGLVGGCLLWDS